MFDENFQLTIEFSKVSQSLNTGQLWVSMLIPIDYKNSNSDEG